MNISSNDTPSVLDGYQFNTDYERELLPVTIIMAVSAAVGAAGNMFVLIVYLKKDIAKRETTYFVPFLAVFDLLACLMLAISSIIQNSFFVYYPSNALCKILSFMTMYSSGTSAGLIFVIALQRYLKVCSKRKTMKLFWRQIAVMIVIMGHFILNIPTLMFAGNGNVTRYLGDKMIKAQACRFGTGLKPKIELIYQTSLLVWVFLVLLATIGLYIPIGCLVHTKKWQNKVSPQNSKNDFTKSREFSLADTTKKSETVPTDEIQEIDITPDDMQTDQHLVTAGPSNVLKTANLKRTEICQSHTDNHAKEQELKANSKSRQTLASKNFNLMLTTIVSAYALSYLPSSATLIISGVIGNNIYSFPTWALNAYRILQNFAIINHIVNPFIYVYFDLQFRSIIKAIFNIN